MDVSVAFKGEGVGEAEGGATIASLAVAESADSNKAQTPEPTSSDHAPGQYDEEVVKLAIEVLEQCRTSLMMSFRFLDRSLWKMRWEPAPILLPLECDGETMWFNPILVLARFRLDSNELVRDMLHTLIHCILRHPFDKTHENTRAWWLVCDIVAESTALDMAGTAFPSQLDGVRTAQLAHMRKRCEVMTPQLLYDFWDKPVRFASPDEGADDALVKLESLFARDSHARWPQFFENAHNPNEDQPQPESMTSDESRAEGAQADDADETGNAQKGDDESAVPENPSDADSSEEPHESNQFGDADNPEQVEHIDAENAPNDGDSSYDPEDARSLSSLAQDDTDELEEEWREISLRIQEDLETFSKKRGDATGGLLANMRIANRKPVNYADFLRRFATMREDMCVNDDEFDYIFYTFGMDHYGNMPLVEPLEYQESNRVRDFVIALDTSGSCSGNLLSNFIDRTFQILSQAEKFGNKINIHIIQCDAAIREDVKITSLDELKRFGDTFRVKGLGGTDFRPVFEYVDELIAEGEFDDLRGLIYFTDGYGIFPGKMPDYDVAFVFVEDGGRTRDVPPWAMKVILSSEQIRVL